MNNTHAALLYALLTIAGGYGWFPAYAAVYGEGAYGLGTYEGGITMMDCSIYNAQVLVRDDFGAAYNVLTHTQELLLNARCGDQVVSIDVGNGASNLFVYAAAYSWHNGTWTTLSLVGKDAYGMWYRGSASSTLTVTSATKTAPGYYVAYTCQRQPGAWKCGCRDKACSTSYWQLQGFKK